MENKLLIGVTGLTLIVVAGVSDFSGILDYLAFLIGLGLLGGFFLDLYFIFREKRRRKKC